MNRKSFHRFATSLAVAVALSLGSAIAAHASEIVIKYKLGGGTQTGVIKVPANTPVQLLADQNVEGDIGVAELVVQNVPVEGLIWSGSSSVEGPIRSWNYANGTHIAYIDYVGDVSLVLQTVLDKKANIIGYGFIIVNSGGSAAIGQVKLIY